MLLEQIENEEYRIHKEVSFTKEFVKDSELVFKKLVAEGKIKGSFEDEKWEMFTNISWRVIDFNIDKSKYERYSQNIFEFSYNEMRFIMRSFAIYCHGSYIVDSIIDLRINPVKRLLETPNNSKLKVSNLEKIGIVEFCMFLELDKEYTNKILSKLNVEKKDGGQRKLKPVINYLVIQDAVDSLFKSDLDDDTFIKWFPVFFWVKITFILPLRATEMLLTPYKCIKRDGNEVTLYVRRTRLKGTKKRVYYSVEKDYGMFEYKLSDSNVVKIIEKYIEITKYKERKFLFLYDDNVINKMMSLDRFNVLVGEFIEKYIMNNDKYEFIRYASGIKEFEKVTAGDSRPIALVNLYFSNVSADVCRQLANHSNVNTTYGYYTNVSEIIMGTSIMKFQKDIKNEISTDLSTGIKCKSQKKAVGNFEDCDKHHPADECIGCKYYGYNKEELAEYEKKYRELTNNAAQRAILLLNDALRLREQNITVEELFMEVQKNAIRYKSGADMIVKEKYREWQENKNLTKTFC